MVNVTIECDEKIRHFQGDMVITLIIQQDGDMVKTTVDMDGEGSLGQVVNAFSNAVPYIIWSMSANQVEAMITMVAAYEGIKERSKQYVNDHAEEIIKNMKKEFDGKQEEEK